MGFGTFYTRIHKGRKARNFKTGELIKYKDVRQAAFKPGVLLKKAVRAKKASSGNLYPLLLFSVRMFDYSRGKVYSENN
jgi:hypothetical protein